MVFGPLISQSIYVVAKLGLADLLVSGPKTIAELASQTGMNADALGRVLRALRSVGIFRSEGDRVALNPAADALRSDAPSTVRDFAIMTGEKWHVAAVGDLLESVRTGSTAFDRLYGMPLFEYFAKHPDVAQIFDAAMTSVSSGDSPAIVAAYDFSRFEKIVDVAGGRGHDLAAMLRKAPTTRGLLFDVPHAIDAAETHFDRSLRERVEFVRGDFLKSVPSGADAYFLKHIIHDWDDERCTIILGNCRRAIRAGGRLLVAEFVVPEGDGPAHSKLLDLEMLLFAPNGRERTAAEYRALLATAGFSMTRIVPTATEISVIEAVPA